MKISAFDTFSAEQAEKENCCFKNTNEEQVEPRDLKEKRKTRKTEIVCRVKQTEAKHEPCLDFLSPPFGLNPASGLPRLR